MATSSSSSSPHTSMDFDALQESDTPTGGSGAT